MLHPSVEIPERKRLKVLLEERYLQLKDSLLDDIRPQTKVSLAIDCWTSPNHLSFMAVTAYYITTDWSYREDLLAFEPMQGSHTGRNMAIVIDCIVQEYQIGDRLYAITADNTSNNDAFCQQLEEILSDWNIH